MLNHFNDSQAATEKPFDGGIEEASTAAGSTDDSEDGMTPQPGPQGLSELADAKMPQKMDNKRVPPSHTAESQALKRARKRYRQEGGLFIKGRPGPEDTWIPEPGAVSFPSLDEALEHEKQKTLLRRATWKNLTGDGATTRRVVREEGSETRQRVSDEAESTRQHLTDTRNALVAQIENVRASTDNTRQEGSKSSGENIALLSRVVAELRVPEIRQLLSGHDVRPVGTKHTLAHLVATHLSEGQLDDFVSRRSKQPRTANANGQQTLASMFSE